MFKVGDEVLVKGSIVKIEDDEYDACPVAVGFDKGRSEWYAEEELIPVGKTYEQGLADAWQLAKKIVLGIKDGGFDSNRVMDVFGLTPYYVLREFTAAEALAKIEAYEFMKKIKEGDVVEANNGLKGVVVKILPGGGLNIIHENGLFSLNCQDVKYKKTGKHIDIESLLRQIGE